jgi:pimeloyl-ACP methyl ester carboxylesterase
MSYFTLKSGEKLYYEDRGEGPDTLVMLHGWTSSHEVYVKTGGDAAEAGQVHHL